MGLSNISSHGELLKVSLAAQRFGRPRRVDHEVKRSRPSGQHGETLSLLKIQKLAGHGPKLVVLATPEAEAGELLEPRRRRLQ